MREGGEGELSLSVNTSNQAMCLVGDRNSHSDSRP